MCPNANRVNTFVLHRGYRRQDVYEEDMLHRAPGDASALDGFETRFDVVRDWIDEEPETSESFTRYATMLS